MRILVIFVFIFFSQQSEAQELFVYTEPASNMAAKSIGVRLTNKFEKEAGTGKYSYAFSPEIMFGVSKKIMIHVEAFFDTYENYFKSKGAALYLKYRFYSNDEVHSHFRMAAFARGAYNNSIIYYPSIDLSTENTGYEAGVVATKLMNKLALSATGSFVHATNNAAMNKFYYPDSRNALSYSLSAGRLMLPKEYTDYKQANLNVMIELLGQTNLNSSETYLDLAPSLQFIFLSKMRLDVGYRFALVNDLIRNRENGFLVRFEYNFFNAYK